MLIKRRLSARVIRENKDCFLSLAPSDLKNKGADDLINNRKLSLRLNNNNLVKKASPNINNFKTNGSIDVDTPIIK
jgi:hypothetical protein